MTLVKIGLLSHSMMRETRSYAILAIFVIAALITPTPDMMTLSLLAVPMVILYEICIWLSYFHEKKIKKLEEEEEKERMARLLSSSDDDPDLDPDHDPYHHDDHDPYHHDEYHDDHDPNYHPDHENMDLAGEDEDAEDTDDYMDYPGEHQTPKEDPNHESLPEDNPDYDPLLPDEDLPDEEKDRK
jgi:sec-independent protein translocase protein TatC